METQYTFPLRGFEVKIVRSDSLSYGLKLFLCQSLDDNTINWIDMIYSIISF